MSEGLSTSTTAVLHHYVPRWFQRRFLGAGQSRFRFYLDLSPEVKVIRDGKPILRKAELEWGPARCFAQDHLYSSRRFTNVDALERFLFGPLDHLGATGLDIVEQNTWEQRGADCISATVEFFDALKLRTPKGLDWLFAQASRNAYLPDALWIAAQNHDLRREVSLMTLQQLRLLHTTMWWEGVWEIVSSAKSDIKFICSDHPVTVYNPACFPLSNDMKYPNEPSILLRGTRTLIPLSYRSCLVISNLEYVREPGKKYLSPRTNARFFGQPRIFDVRSILRGRELSSEEVAAINFIIKRRAKRYIASAEPCWLYPERVLKDQHWSKLDSVLLPNEDEAAFHHGGEFFWGNDKWMVGADEFGRPLNRQKIEDALKSQAQIKAVIEERNKSAKKAAVASVARRAD